MTLIVIHVQVPRTGPPEPYGAWYIAFLAMFGLWWVVFGHDIERRQRRRRRVRC
jgi:hypothetical protein